MRRAGELGQWGEFRRYQVFTAFDFGISSAKFCTVIVIIPASLKMPCPMGLADISDHVAPIVTARFI